IQMPIGSWYWKRCWQGERVIMAETDSERTPVTGTRVDVDVRSVDELYAMYMPFIAGGGMFLGSHRLGECVCELGTELLVNLRLSVDDEQLTVPGRVVWLTPSGRR